MTNEVGYDVDGTDTAVLDLGLTDLGIVGWVENYGLMGLLVAQLTCGGVVVDGARIWDFRSI